MTIVLRCRLCNRDYHPLNSIALYANCRQSNESLTMRFFRQDRHESILPFSKYVIVQGTHTVLYDSQLIVRSWRSETDIAERTIQSMIHRTVMSDTVQRVH